MGSIDEPAAEARDDGWVPEPGVGEPDEKLELDDLDLMREATHPIRGLILRRLKLPHTVAEVAAAMGVPVTRLYHHVNRLVDDGLIRVVATRQVAAVTERRYQVVARSFSIDPELFTSGDRHELAQAMGSIFDLAKLGFQRLVETGGYESVTDPEHHSTISLGEIHLTEERRRELLDRLAALFEEFKSDARERDTASPMQAMTLFVAAYPEP